VEKFLVIEGKVVGGHRLADLGVDVPYQKEVTLNYDRANWSRDLNHALQNGQVKKVRVISGNEMSTRKPTPKKKRKVTPKRPKSPTPTQQVSAEPEKSAPTSEEENKRLRKMNEDLIERTNQLFEQQQKLMEQLSNFMEQPPTQYVPTNQPLASGSTTQEEDEDDTPTFIPSKIRSGKAKANKGSEVEAERKESKSFASAAEALKAMRQGQEDEDDNE